MAIALAIVLLAPLARSEISSRKGARITWVRGIDAERCVGQVALEEDVKARLGYDPFVLPSELSVEGAIVQQRPAGFRAELVIRDAKGNALGTRQLASREADCRSLGEAVAVAITVAIDPDAAGTRAPLALEVPPEPETAPRAAAPAVSTPPPREHGRATLAIGASAGLIPGIAPVASLRARKTLGASWELGVGAHFLPESRTLGIGLALASGSIDACAAPLSSAPSIRWCAAVHVGAFQVFVHAPELAPLDVGMFPWSAGETGPALSIPLGGALRLDAGVAAVVPFTRRQALFRGRTEPVWEQAYVGGRADLGLGATF